MLTDTLSMVFEQDSGVSLQRAPVHSPEEAIELCRDNAPDVVLMDVEFKGPMSGIEGARRIKEVAPRTAVVIMTAHEDERLLVDAVEAGACGFLKKSEGTKELVGVVKAAAAGDFLIDRSELARLLPEVAKDRASRREANLLLDQLTDREREILQLLAEGLRNEEIAAQLFISAQTVQTHIRNVLSKLGVHSKLEAVIFAAKNGAVTVGPLPRPS